MNMLLKCLFFIPIFIQQMCTDVHDVMDSSQCEQNWKQIGHKSLLLGSVYFLGEKVNA